MPKSSPTKQQTLRKSFEINGVGLHSGEDVCVRGLPADEGQGVIFRRVDLPGKPEIHMARAKAEENAMTRQTTLSNGNGASVATVEHFLSATLGLSIDNITFEVDRAELPLLDGSALPIVEALKGAGIEEQSSAREVISFEEPICWREGTAEICYLPDDQLRATYFADYPSPIVGTQSAYFAETETDYTEEIAPARTFVFIEELEGLRKAGLIRGGSLENALVITNTEYINGPTRFANEPARHKLLDLLGDLMLLGKRFHGHILAYRTGHRLNSAFVEHLLKVAAQKNADG